MIIGVSRKKEVYTLYGDIIITFLKLIQVYKIAIDCLPDIQCILLYILLLYSQCLKCCKLTNCCGLAVALQTGHSDFSLDHSAMQLQQKI